MDDKKVLFENVKNLDFETIKENFAEDWDMFQFSVKIYVENYLNSYETLATTIDSGDQEEIHRLIHSLKGAFNQIGALEVGSYFAELELLAKDGNFDSIREQMETIKGKIESVNQDIQTLKEA